MPKDKRKQEIEKLRLRFVTGEALDQILSLTSNAALAEAIYREAASWAKKRLAKGSNGFRDFHIWRRSGELRAKLATAKTMFGEKPPPSWENVDKEVGLTEWLTAEGAMDSAKDVLMRIATKQTGHKTGAVMVAYEVLTTIPGLKMSVNRMKTIAEREERSRSRWVRAKNGRMKLRAKAATDRPKGDTVPASGPFAPRVARAKPARKRR